MLFGGIFNSFHFNIFSIDTKSNVIDRKAYFKGIYENTQNEADAQIADAQILIYCFITILSSDIFFISTHLNTMSNTICYEYSFFSWNGMKMGSSEEK